MSNYSVFKNDSSVKRMSLKSIIQNSKCSTLPLKDFDPSDHYCGALKKSIEAIFTNLPISYTLEELFSFVQSICISKQLNKLYTLIEDVFRQHVLSLRGQISISQVSSPFEYLLWPICNTTNKGVLYSCITEWPVQTSDSLELLVID
ncbi:hypothetical protein Ciccas_007983 [Cichlidogyrus casuarinus]|uniref:Cullin N-terminal domain-containing protein n=1 Tax=Cichlidogyrus casuarinus TaxID=1844966 RepID=A0ABD2Q1A1_9PLAT